MNPASSPIAPVDTTSGAVSGVPHPHGSAYLSIPFAAPPVGANRFLAPQPRAPWSGVRACDAYGPTPQRRPFGVVTTIPEPSIPGDDTLSLSVFTPAAGEPDAGLPVFVWIHGGGYFAGSPASPWYDGRSFARDGVVTVVISYRLGFDGFGWIDGAPLNRGVLDQIAALEWVRDNIRGFGGDPERVTIAGQSAGGGSVLTLLASPAAEGLFSAVISHSGAVGSLTVPDAEAIGRRFAEELGIEPTLAGWRSVDETQILDSQNEFNQVPDAAGATSTPTEIVAAIRARPIESMGLAFAPVIDDETVRAPSKTMTAGHSARIPLLIGTTRDEFSFETAGTAETGSAALERTITDLARAGIGESEIAQYRREVERIGVQFATSQLVTAQMFRAPAAGIAALRAAHGAGDRTWLYDFAHPSAITDLASHCHELPFAWDVLDAEGVSAVLGDAPQTLADEVHDVWVRFITHGTTGWASVADNAAGARVFGASGGYDRQAYAFEHALLGDAR
ncbi:carboxylesterase family protein [Agreia pratensis]|uniref:carboxylesterase/lipase family protein n=1 Tax=Agreia pratensis TaxID=150121 RepID=UPI00188C53CE|nr:carboxylesterase family protein [Agreia pratensis]MBF4636124.1 carboxylesterase family protein [Agreia pratensis]